MSYIIFIFFVLNGCFYIIFENGVSPNLLDCIQSIAPDWLKDIELSDKEIKLLDNEYPYKKANEILDSLGFRNRFTVVA